ncbi:MAG: hypothetical protein J2P37_20915 [Ktedonobacteraceae bacterium]|nr:hypothetical protein [Ktedonobacteraceae bacterium]
MSDEDAQREQYAAPMPADPTPSAHNTEDLERLAAPLLAIERGLPLLSRLLAR